MGMGAFANANVGGTEALQYNGISKQSLKCFYYVIKSKINKIVNLVLMHV